MKTDRVYITIEKRSLIALRTLLLALSLLASFATYRLLFKSQKTKPESVDMDSPKLSNLKNLQVNFFDLPTLFSASGYLIQSGKNEGANDIEYYTLYCTNSHVRHCVNTRISFHKHYDHVSVFTYEISVSDWKKPYIRLNEKSGCIMEYVTIDRIKRSVLVERILLAPEKRFEWDHSRDCSGEEKRLPIIGRLGGFEELK